MKMTRKRVDELEGTECCLTYMGPIDTRKRFCEEGAPTTTEACGFFTDESEWVYDTIQVEPEWVLKQFPPDHLYANRWYAGRKLRDWVGFSLLTWKTKERAEIYLNLLKEDWWDDNN